MSRTTCGVAGILALSLIAAASGAEELAVTVKPDSGDYTHPDYPANIFDLPQPQYPAPPQALEVWREQRFGLFVHWGVYSVLEGEWQGEEIPKLGEQIQRHAKISGREYAEVARKFNPVKFDASEYARLAKAAGMNYIILTAKHHDGFCMFDSKYTDFDIMDASPYKKDIVRAFANACREEGLHFGVYYSNPDWHHNNHSPTETEFSVHETFGGSYIDFMRQQLRELLTNYGPINEVFFDMGMPTLEQSAALAKTVRTCRPNCLVSGRVMNRQGDFLTMSDNGEPSKPIDTPWEVPCTFTAEPFHTWGYKSWVTRPPVDEEIARRIQQLSRVASRGGNYLLNIGPLPDGTILPYHVTALEGIGKWVRRNQEAIFGTNPTPFTFMPWGEATWRPGKLYLHVADWPADRKLVIPGLRASVSRVFSLSQPEKLYSFAQDGVALSIDVPPTAPDPNLTILVAEFEGQLAVDRPFVHQESPNTIVLDDGFKRVDDFYGGITYKSVQKGVRNSWEFKVTHAGTYTIDISYRLFGKKRIDELLVTDKVPIVTTVGGREFHVGLPLSPGKDTVRLGAFKVVTPGARLLAVTMDLEKLKMTEREFRLDHAPLLLDIERITLTREPQ